MVIILIWVMFAILGMNLLSDKLGYCKGSPTIYGYGQDRVYISFNIKAFQCITEGYEWSRRDTNFDNIFHGMLTLFVLSTLEG